MPPSVALAATHPASARAVRANSVLESVRWTLRAVMHRAKAARAQTRTMKVLRSLNDDALSDIGLRRDQIDYVQHDPRYGTRNLRL